MVDKILNLLGIAAKAGKIKSGSFAAEEAIKNKTAILLIMAEDASEGTKKTIWQYEHLLRGRNNFL